MKSNASKEKAGAKVQRQEHEGLGPRAVRGPPRDWQCGWKPGGLKGSEGTQRRYRPCPTDGTWMRRQLKLLMTSSMRVLEIQIC